MRNLFITNFANLKQPALSMSKIKSASLEELKQMRREAESIEYQSSISMEPIIMEYVNAQRVWVSFMERAMTCNFEDIFHTMIYILHFIHDVKAFKERHTDKLFIHEAEKREWLMRKVRKCWKTVFANLYITCDRTQGRTARGFHRIDKTMSRENSCLHFLTPYPRVRLSDGIHPALEEMVPGK